MKYVSSKTLPPHACYSVSVIICSFCKNKNIIYSFDLCICHHTAFYFMILLLNISKENLKLSYPFTFFPAYNIHTKGNTSEDKCVQGQRLFCIEKFSNYIFFSISFVLSVCIQYINIGCTKNLCYMAVLTLNIEILNMNPHTPSNFKYF